MAIRLLLYRVETWVVPFARGVVCENGRTVKKIPLVIILIVGISQELAGKKWKNSATHNG